MFSSSTVFSIGVFVFGVLGGLSICRASVCGETSPSPADHAVDLGARCDLDKAAHAAAVAQAKDLNARSLVSVETTITASYRGDKAVLDDQLTAIIKREASCCSHLAITKTETRDGYDLVVTGGRNAISQLQAMLEVSR